MPSSPISTYSAPVDFRIGSTPSPGIQDPNARDSIWELYMAMQQVIQTLMMYCGIGQQPAQFWNAQAGSPAQLLNAGNLNRVYVVASENISFGAIVNLWSNAGVLNARNANATNNTKPADGFCSTTAGINAGDVGEIQLNNGVATINGLTIGQRYWLSTTDGLVSNAPAVAAGNIEQYIGIAVTTTQLSVNLGFWLQH